MKRMNLGLLFAAILLILLGLAMAGITFFGWIIPWVAGWWTFVIMAAAILFMVSHGPRFWNCLLLGGAILTFARMQDFLIRSWVQLWGSFLALALVLLGITLIVRMVRGPRARAAYQYPPPAASNDAPPSPTWSNATRSDMPHNSEQRPTRLSLFSSETYRSDCKRFLGGRFIAIFGGMLVDLTQIDFDRPILIDVYNIFGGIDVVTPPNVRVECTGTAVFGGCDAKAITGRPFDAARPTLTLRYTSIFGGVNVR